MMDRKRRGEQLAALRRFRIEGTPEASAHALKMVLWAVDSYANPSCWASSKTIADCLLLDERTVRRALRTLQERGYLEITERPGRSNLISLRWDQILKTPGILPTLPRTMTTEPRALCPPTPGILSKTPGILPTEIERTGNEIEKDKKGTLSSSERNPNPGSTKDDLAARKQQLGRTPQAKQSKGA